MNRDEAKQIIELLEHIRELQNVNKITSTFIPPFYEKSIKRKDSYFLNGSFHVGPKSGRLASSQPNLQQIPSTGTKYAKAIKRCFLALKGWLLVGADYFSLEDRISALQTKDKNKLKVYTDHYDGHCLRAYSYFQEEMPDIDPKNVDSVNSIATKYPKRRQDSKTPTFALTYQGTWKTLVKNCGFTKEEAQKIEQAFKELYAESDAWVQERLREASERGYASLAFGLRLRTPLLQKTVWDSPKRPYEAVKEAKTVGNALTQSYGLLTTRATNMFMDRVWNSPYRYCILPVAQIHDATYFMIKSRVDVIEWTNNNLIECMTYYDDLPEIQHEKVKLEAELELYYPSWAEGTKLKNNASPEEIRKILYNMGIITDA